MSDAPVVLGFTLINADTNQPILELTQNAVISLASLPTRNLNIRANTAPSVIGSVRFGLNGNNNFRTENAAPYALAGDTAGDYWKWTPSVGSYLLTATAYSGPDASGTAGAAVTIGFQVVESNPAPAPGPAPAPTPGATASPMRASCVGSRVPCCASAWACFKN